MKAPRPAWAFATAGLLVFACSAPPPPRETTPTATASALVAPPTSALEPVARPAGVVARARIKSPAVTAKVGAQLTGAPAEGGELVVKTLVAELLGKRGLRLDVDGRALADEVVTDAPVDLLVALAEGGRPEPMIAVSIAVRSAEGAAAAAGASAQPAGPDAWALGGKKAKGACTITRANGPSVARLVCGTSPRDVEVLGPYLTRTLAAEPSGGADVVAEIDVAELDAKFGSDLRKILPSLPSLVSRRYGTGNAVFDKALAEGGKLLGGEAAKLLGDVDKVSLELSADPKAGVSLGATATFRDRTSWIARTAFAVPAGPAPDMFWRGPKDATSAGFTTMGDPASYAEGVQILKDLVLGSLADMKLGNEAERKKLAALLDFPFEKAAVIATYSGSDRLTKPAEPKTPKEKWQRAFAELSGWSIVGTTLKPDAVSKWLKDLVAGFNQPGVQKVLRASDVAISMKAGKAPEALGKGASLVEVRIQSKQDKSDATLLLLVSPGREGAWLGMGVERDELVERLLRAKDGKEPLKDRADLAPLRTGTATTGYFFSTATFKSSLLPVVLMKKSVDPKTMKKPEDEVLEAVKELNAMFDTLPQKGGAPAFITSTTVSGAKPATKLSFVLPRGAITELSRLMQGAAR